MKHKKECKGEVTTVNESDESADEQIPTWQGLVEEAASGTKNFNHYWYQAGSTHRIGEMLSAQMREIRKGICNHLPPVNSICFITFDTTLGDVNECTDKEISTKIFV